MNLIKDYTAGLNKAFDLKKVVSVIYGITLLLGLVAAFTFQSLLFSNFDNRPELFKLLKDFNFSIYSDFMNNYGEIIRPFIEFMIWFGVFYFIFTIFFAGGILSLFEEVREKNKSQYFFAKCAKYFFRFLRLGIYTLLIQIVLFLPVAFIFASIFSNALPESTEPALFTILFIWLAVHLLIFLFITIVSDYAKVILVSEDSVKVWQALKKGFIFAFKKIHLTYPLYLLLLIVPLGLTIIYFLFDAAIGMTSIVTVIIMLIIQQLLIWSRLFVKVWILGSEYCLYNNSTPNLIS